MKNTTRNIAIGAAVLGGLYLASRPKYPKQTAQPFVSDKLTAAGVEPGILVVGPTPIGQWMVIFVWRAQDGRRVQIATKVRDGLGRPYVGNTRPPAEMVETAAGFAMLHPTNDPDTETKAL